MKFRYLGEAPEGSITMYGATFEAGGVGDVTDARWIAKLTNHPLFEEVDEGQPSPAAEPKKRGRPPKPKEPLNGN